MKQFINLSACITLAIAAVSCNSDDRAKYERIAVPEGLKRDFLFNKGTYWIYAGVNSGTVDSLYIVEGNTEWQYEDNRRLVIEDITRTAYVVRVVGVPNSNSLKYKDASLYGSSFGGRVWPLGSYSFPFFRQPTATYQGNTFNDVALVLTPYDSVVLKERVGVIRYRNIVDGVGGNEVYELLRWNIVQ